MSSDMKHLLGRFVAMSAIMLLGITALVLGTASPARADSSAQIDGAVSWAESEMKLNPNGYDLQCLAFVADAYRLGGGVGIGSSATPVTYWNDHPTLHNGDTNAPEGALVFWGGNQWVSDGHVALSLGQGMVISSGERGTHTIHTFAIADRNNDGYASSYLGWMMPPGVPAPTGSASYADGTYLSVIETGAVYVVAGGSPLRVASWGNVGGVHPVTSVHQSVIDGMRPYPADGTYVNASPSGRVFVFAGGAPLRVSNWANVGGVHVVTTVDDYAIDHQDHVLAVPANGVYINAMPSGRVFLFAGGAPLQVSNWNNVGGIHPLTTVDDYAVNALDHMGAYPADGTYINAMPDGSVFVFAGGAPLRVSNWANVGGPREPITVDVWAINNLNHVRAYPADGAYVTAQPSGRVFVFAGGAALRVASWSNVGGVHGFTIVDDYAIDSHDHSLAYPANGTVLDGGPSGNVYIVAGGSPLRVSSWGSVGGVKPYTVVDDWAIINQLRQYPADGTLVLGYVSGREYLIANQHSVYQSPTTGSPVPVDDWAIDHQLLVS